MKLLYSKKDFENFYHYDKKYLKESVYPKEYPCIARKVVCGGGLAGEWIDHKFTYIDKKYDLCSFLAGYNTASNEN